jgi:hypothetical protein
MTAGEAFNSAPGCKDRKESMQRHGLPERLQAGAVSGSQCDG